jgi:hypothetical protein
MFFSLFSLVLSLASPNSLLFSPVSERSWPEKMKIGRNLHDSAGSFIQTTVFSRFRWGYHSHRSKALNTRFFTLNTNMNSDLANKRWNSVDLHLKLRFQIFFNLFKVFSKEKVSKSPIYFDSPFIRIHKPSLSFLQWKRESFRGYLNWNGDSNKEIFGVLRSSFESFW